MLYKAIMSYIKFMRFLVLPVILSGIACFIGPPRSPSLKVAMAIVIALAIQHRYMVPAFKAVQKDFFDALFGDENLD